MTAVMKTGRRVNLKQQNKPTCNTGCPAGQTMECGEDEEQLMSICRCVGGGGGGIGTAALIAIIPGGG